MRLRSSRYKIIRNFKIMNSGIVQLFSCYPAYKMKEQFVVQVCSVKVFV